MDKLINLNTYPVSENLKALLKDKTTKKNIIFATSVYSSKGTPIKETEQMTEEILKGFTQYEIQPRVLKNKEQQQERTKAKAEVFTPSWICNKMNNHCDEEWFGRKNVFNTEQEQGWLVNTEKVGFDTEDGWKKYVDSKRLEITCGEAPYIVSRYDAATGELLEIRQRIGILDRKLRVVNENTVNETEWFKWVLRAYQSVYGYEFQGDSLLIARINLLITFVDYMQDRWGRVPTDAELRKIVNVIVWNLWQMDGISGTIPFGKPKEEYHQFSLFDFVVADEPEKQDTEEPEEVYCRIYDWRSDKSLTYKSMKEAMDQLSKGHPYDMSTNIFDRLPQFFFNEAPNDGNKYIRILGRENSQRVYKYIRSDYVNQPKNLFQYKIFLPSANGNGVFGETLTAPVLGIPGIGSTETFISVGCFDSKAEATNLLKYIKSKFARAMLNVLKITQHLTPDVWKYVPRQDFTDKSDIDWSVSIANIDKQLYKKYGLSEEEIAFIETNVKEME